MIYKKLHQDTLSFSPSNNSWYLVVPASPSIKLSGRPGCLVPAQRRSPHFGSLELCWPHGAARVPLPWQILTPGNVLLHDLTWGCRAWTEPGVCSVSWHRFPQIQQQAAKKVQSVKGKHRAPSTANRAWEARPAPGRNSAAHLAGLESWLGCRGKSPNVQYSGALLRQNQSLLLQCFYKFPLGPSFRGLHKTQF